MKHIQTKIHDKDYLRLKLFCDMYYTSIGQAVRNLISNFVSSKEFSAVEEYARVVYRLGGSPSDNKIPQELSEELVKISKITEED